MMRRIIYAPLFMMFISCETPFDPKIEKNEEIVVNAFFRPGDPFAINLAKSNFILDTERVIPVPDASVIISDFQGLNETITGDGNGNFSSSFYPESGKTYHLRVQVPGFPDITATDKIPEAINPLSFSLQTKLSSVNLDEFGYQATLRFKDPPEIENFYGVEIVINNSGTGNPLSGDIGFLFTEDPDVNTIGDNDVNIGNPTLLEAPPVLFFDDVKFDGKTHQFKFFIAPVGIDFSGNVNPDVYVILKSISENYYNYLLTSFFQKETEDQESFSEPVQVANNIENGLGIFAGYNFEIMKAELID